MHAEIRRFHSPDIDDLADWAPPSPRNFGFLLQVLVGPSDSEGEESFDLIVCSPEWLRAKHSTERFVFGRHHLIVLEYDFSLIEEAIAALVRRTHGATWSEIATQLGRYGRWEFEDYRE